MGIHLAVAKLAQKSPLPNPTWPGARGSRKVTLSCLLKLNHAVPLKRAAPGCGPGCPLSRLQRRHCPLGGHLQLVQVQGKDAHAGGGGRQRGGLERLRALPPRALPSFAPIPFAAGGAGTAVQGWAHNHRAWLGPGLGLGVTQIYPNVSKQIKIHQNTSKCIKVYQNIFKHIKTYQNITKYIKMYPNMPRKKANKERSQIACECLQILFRADQKKTMQCGAYFEQSFTLMMGKKCCYCV